MTRMSTDLQTLRRLVVIASTFVALCIPAQPLPAQERWSLLEGARAHPDYRGSVPKKADVVVSVRFKRQDAVEAIKAFGANRVEWSYITQPEVVAQLKSTAGWFGGSINSTPKMPDEEGMAKDFDGKSIVNPRMKSWNVQWSTSTNPKTKKRLRDLAKSYLDLGASSIQVDDPLLELYAAQLWGGDFNASTLAGFPRFLEDYPDRERLRRAELLDFRGDYREYLKSRFGIRDAKEYAKRQAALPTTPIWLAYLQQTVTTHYVELRAYLKQVRGADVPLSMNLTFLDRPSEANRHFFLATLADYSMAETPVGDALDLQMRAATARALGLGFVPSIKPKDHAANRVAIATLTALGANPIVPWDVYVGNDEAGLAKRMYGTPQEYGDLYETVRRHPGLFNEREQAAMVGIVVPVDHFDERATLALVNRLNQRRIPFAFVVVGGRQPHWTLDETRAGHFRLLVTVNRDDDFAQADLNAQRSAPVERIAAAQLTDAKLDEMTPFIAAGEAAGLRLYPRAKTNPGSKDQLVVHVVDEARGAPGNVDGSCRRRIGLRRAVLGDQAVDAVYWYTAVGQPVALDVTRSDRDFFVTVPECRLWGMLAVTLKN